MYVCPPFAAFIYFCIPCCEESETLMHCFHLFFLLCKQDEGKLTEKVDVYSFGVLLSELLSGERQWTQYSVQQIMKACLINRKHPPVPASVPPALAQLCEDCMAFEASARPSFAVIVARLRELSVTLGAEAEPWAVPKSLVQALQWQSVNNLLRVADVPLQQAAVLHPELQQLLTACAGLKVSRVRAIDNKTLADRFAAQYVLCSCALI